MSDNCSSLPLSSLHLFVLIVYLFHLTQIVYLQSLPLFRHTSVSANDGDWHHICTTWKNIAGSWKLFKDGRVAASGHGLAKGKHLWRHLVKLTDCRRINIILQAPLTLNPAASCNISDSSIFALQSLILFQNNEVGVPSYESLSQPSLSLQ